MAEDADTKPRPSVDLAGGVLAGGASSRMGRDKASLPWDEEGRTTWLERALRELSRIVEAPVALGATRIPGFANVADVRTGVGPLGGVEALLVTARRPALVIPCDLPGLSGEVLGLLVAAREKSHFDAGPPLAFAFRHTDGRPEPAVAVFEPAALPILRHFLDGGRRGVAEFLDSVPTQWIEIPEAAADAFVNVNTPEELARWRERTSRGSAT